MILLAGGSSPWPRCWILQRFQRVSLGSGRDWGCVLCADLPPSTAAWLLGRGGTMGREGRWGGCKEKGLLSYSLSPNISQRTGLFLLLALWPCPPCCFVASSRTLQHRALCASQYLPGDKTPCRGWEGAKKQRKTKHPFTPSFPPFPKTKDCKYCVSCLFCPASPLCPSPAISPGVGCSLGGGKKGKEESPRLEHASPNESSSREKVKDEAAQAFKYP